MILWIVDGVQINSLNPNGPIIRIVLGLYSNLNPGSCTCHLIKKRLSPSSLVLDNERLIAYQNGVRATTPNKSIDM